jgi:hypothetical protein
MSQNATSRSGLVKEVIKRLREQAYLFVIGLVILVIAALYIPSQNTPLTIVAVLGALGLAAFTIASVERRKGQLVEEVGEKSVLTDSPEERVQVERLQNERAAIQGLLEGLVSNDEDTYFIYSSTVVDKVYDHSKPPKEIDLPYYEDVREVTTLLDTRGIAKLYALLYTAGKTDRLHEGTAETFDPTNWASNLILVGSGLSNPVTEQTLGLFDVPFRFSTDLRAIERRDKESGKEPSRFEHTHAVDHAILAKLKRRTAQGTRVYLVAAGIGAWGTVAACSFLASEATDLYRRFADSPFACIIQVDPRQWTMPRELDSQALAVASD